MTAREDRGVQVEARTLSGDIDPEGFVRYGAGCICGPVYTYAGQPEPGHFAPDCPVHGEPPTDLVTLTDGGASE